MGDARTNHYKKINEVFRQSRGTRNQFITSDSDVYQTNIGKRYYAWQDEDNVTGINFGFKTPTNKEIHMVASFKSENDSVFRIRENITIDSGTLCPIFLRNRNYAEDSELLTTGTINPEDSILKDIGWTDFGTIIVKDSYIAALPNPLPVDRKRDGLVLKRDTSYGVFLTTDGEAQHLHLELDWIEDSTLSE